MWNCAKLLDATLLNIFKLKNIIQFRTDLWMLCRIKTNCKDKREIRLIFKVLFPKLKCRQDYKLAYALKFIFSFWQLSPLKLKSYSFIKFHPRNFIIAHRVLTVFIMCSLLWSSSFLPDFESPFHFLIEMIFKEVSDCILSSADTTLWASGAPQ